MLDNYSNKFSYLEVPFENCMKFGRLTNRPYQQYGFNQVIEHVKKTRDPAIVNASVGAGKTVMIAALCKHVSDKGGKVLVLSRQGEIIYQDAQDCWLADCKNSIYSASLGVKSAKYPVILGTEGTVCRALENDLKSIGLIESNEPVEASNLINFVPDLLLIDEAHMVSYMDSDSQYMKIIAELKRRNPKIRIIGLTGTPYRGVEPIIGEFDHFFWRKELTNISTEYLTSKGYLVPCNFGFIDYDTSYNLDGFKSDGNDGIKDYTAEELKRMEKLMVEAETTTEKIMLEVMSKARDRNCVLITCSGKKHCKEAAKFLPKGSYKIVTEEMSPRLRKKALDDAFDGKLKYLLQVGCLTTGINIPLIDTIVILRKIGSLTLLVQLIGRGLRLLKDFQIEQGIIKNDCLVLDYSGTMEEFRELYDNPILEAAEYTRAKGEHETITCPKCNTENSKFAVRCRGEDSGERCDFFWSSKLCENFYVNGKLKQSGCQAENAPTARNCRICDNTLIDPNANLTRTHYKQTDYKPVEIFDMKPTKNDGVLVEYHLPNNEVAKAFYSPFSGNETAKRIFYNKFVKFHATTPSMKKVCRFARNAGELCNHKKELDTIGAITHRLDAKGKSIITKMLTKEEMKKM